MPTASFPDSMMSLALSPASCDITSASKYAAASVICKALPSHINKSVTDRIVRKWTARHQQPPLVYGRIKHWNTTVLKLCLHSQGCHTRCVRPSYAG